MGRVLLILRLAARDARYRPAPAVLLLLAIAAAMTTLTLGLALRGLSNQPYQQTRAATRGPDVVARVNPPDATGGPPADRQALTALTRASGVVAHSGQVWVTRAEAISLATPAEPVSYTLNLKLADPSDADAFASAYDNSQTSASAPFLNSWQDISFNADNLVRNEQRLLMIGSWLLGLLAVASVTVLVGGRMTEQTRRVGLLKAVGSTPGLVAAVLLAEHLLLALLAAGIGLLAGWLVAPLLTRPGAALLGSAGTPPVTVATIGLVVAVALAVAALATLIPAIRAARTSTVRALADSARPPRRRARMIAVSSRLPVPILFGLRVAARRPRRVVLSMISVAITATGIIAVLLVHAGFNASLGAHAGLDNPADARLSQVMTVLSAALVVMTAVNAIIITWATVLDAKHTSALARALGATPAQVTAGLTAAQVMPALAGALLGIPGGIGLFMAVNKDGGPVTIPPAWWLTATVLGTVAAVAALTVIPAWLGTRHPVAKVLQADFA